MPGKDTTGPQGKGAGSGRGLGRGSGRGCVSRRGKQHRGSKGQSDLKLCWNKSGNQFGYWAGNQVKNREHGCYRKNGAGI